MSLRPRMKVAECDGSVVFLFYQGKKLVGFLEYEGDFDPEDVSRLDAMLEKFGMSDPRDRGIVINQTMEELLFYLKGEKALPQFEDAAAMKEFLVSTMEEAKEFGPTVH